MATDGFSRSSSGARVHPLQAELCSPRVVAPQSFAVKFAYPLAFLAIGFMLAVLSTSILQINNGTFVYTLDDPYIHLALSDQIRHGNYGLYSGTHAAPSSSILFPFLLATAAGTPFHPYLPLVINVCALFFTVDIMRRFLLHLRLGSSSFAVAAQAAALVLAAVCFNLIGVVFTGLEHSFHIAAVAATVYGLALFLDQDRVPRWLPAVLVLSPLIRYEGLALSGGVLLVFAMKGQVRTAIATFTCILLLIGSFSVFLSRLGLSPLPSSILSKSAIAAGTVEGARGSFRAGFIQSIDTALGHPIGLLLLLVGVAAALACALEISHHGRRWTASGYMSLALLCLLAGQAVAGRWGWLERYEVYAVLATALIIVYLGQRIIQRALAPGNRDRYVLATGAAVAVFVFGARYVFATANVPLGSNNIYEQQLQMHHFVERFYRGPVAVNDLGLVSYRNPFFVLDLGGLGSEEARKLTANHATASEYETFVAASGIHLIMVYDEWFTGRIPKDWEKVATLSISRRTYSAAHPDVQFYVTDSATAATVSKELAAFRSTLPARVTLTLY